MDPLNDYYQEQAQTGHGYFAGQQYQRGGGFFGRIFKGALLPALKYLSRQALSTGVDVARDVIEEKDNFMPSLKKRLRATGKKVAMKSLDRADDYLQNGQGRKRRVIKRSVIKKKVSTVCKRRKVKKTKSKKPKKIRKTPQRLKSGKRRTKKSSSLDFLM